MALQITRLEGAWFGTGQADMTLTYITKGVGEREDGKEHTKEESGSLVICLFKTFHKHHCWTSVT